MEPQPKALSQGRRLASAAAARRTQSIGFVTVDLTLFLGSVDFKNIQTTISISNDDFQIMSPNTY